MATQHRKKRRQQTHIAVGLLVGSAIFAAILAYGMVKQSQYATANDNYCFEDEVTATTAVFFDSSIFIDASNKDNRDTTRDIKIIFENVFKQLPFNEKLLLLSTQPDQIASVPKERLVICRPPKTADDLKSVGGDPNVTTVFLKKETKKAYDKIFQPVVDDLINEKNRQHQESPLLEYIQAISRSNNFSDTLASRKLIIVSDLIQNRPPIHFCRAKNSLPSFKKFKESSHFSHIKPNRLDGVEVEIYMVVFDSYDQFSFCSEEELRKFFIDYFQAAGAKQPVFHRLLL